jgi:hypothetical protein
MIISSLWTVLQTTDIYANYKTTLVFIDQGITSQGAKIHKMSGIWGVSDNTTRHPRFQFQLLAFKKNVLM